MAKKKRIKDDVEQYLDNLLDIDSSVESLTKVSRAIPKGKGVVQATQVKFNVKNLTDYLKVLSNFREAKVLRPGYFYSFAYKFRTDQAKLDQVRFYDYHPLSYIYWVGKSKQGKPIAMGINFHRLPVQVRYTLLNKVFQFEGVRTDKVTSRKKLNMDYQSLKPYLRKIGFAVRMYRIDRMMKTRLVSLRYIRQVLAFFPETLYQASIKELFDEYRQYKPPKPK